MNKEKLYTEELTIKKWRFWDLSIQKVIRNFTSMKYLIFNQIFIVAVIAVINKLITGAQFTTIVISGLVTIATARVYADTRLKYKNGDTNETK